MPSQREIVFVNFKLSHDTLPHPAIVLSCSKAIEAEDGAFIAVMMTSTEQDDDFTFEITEEMLTHKMSSYQEARLHLVGYFTKEDIIKGKTINYIQETYFKQLVKQINNLAFNFKIDFKTEKDT